MFSKLLFPISLCGFLSFSYIDKNKGTNIVDRINEKCGNSRINENTKIKITNYDENHHGYQYYDGINELDKEFDSDVTNECSEGGLYFTTVKYIDEYIDFGFDHHIDYTSCGWVRKISLLNDSRVVAGEPLDIPTKWRTDKISLDQRYRLSRIESLLLFNINITDFGKHLIWRDVCKHRDCPPLSTTNISDIDSIIDNLSHNINLTAIEIYDHEILSKQYLYEQDYKTFEYIRFIYKYHTLSDIEYDLNYEKNIEYFTNFNTNRGLNKFIVWIYNNTTLRYPEIEIKLK